ncbi:MAG TPA: 23S rRNA (adenine(2030)-N(6))-methyltransferase RlmJ [Methylocella sp.]|nr:23S rRNA (adenine(2030)-N(6))-methyltransferase RlmJ [Methylocella sp.]
MNYRHEFHAGNFADVFKHIFLSRVLLHLGVKPAPFRFIETHAGSGIYDLSSLAAGKTAEWCGGIGKLLAAEPTPEVRPLIERYLETMAPLAREAPPRYGGSPWLARSLLRRQDKALLCELHPQAFTTLRTNFSSDARLKLFRIDGYAGLKAFLPPVERRGLVLIDPPFEAEEEFARAAAAIESAWRKWATGIYMFWYPVKEGETIASLAAHLAAEGIRRILRLEIQTDAPVRQGRLVRCGLILVNPPFRLDLEAKILLPWLAGVLGAGEPDFLVEWLRRE